MWNALIVNPITQGLLALDGFIRAVGIPYSFGFAIILFTIIIKLLTWPLNVQQMRSSQAMQELQPKLQELQRKYRKDRERLAQEQMKLYREAGINPLGGCLPTLIQLPIWIGLYQALFRLAQAGKLQEGFLWIPSLAKPVGLDWLWPPANWQWPDTPAYLVLPILTVVTQIVVQKMMTPSDGPSDPQQAAINQAMMMMPFMFGFFAIQVPSGLSLYWVTMNLLTLLQQFLIMGRGNLLLRRLRGVPAKSPEASKEIPRKGKKHERRGKKHRGQR